MKWILVTIIACCYGFFRDFRPSEAYLTQYLTSEWKNLTLEQVNSDIYPWWTYSYVVWLIPVFLLTDYYRYKPLLVLDAFMYILTWCLLVWAEGIPAMTCMQVLYGLASAAEVGYYSYLYAMVEKKHFRKVTSIVRCSTLMSKFIAFLLGQLFVSFEVMHLRSLNIISFSCVCFAFCLSLFLPKAKSSELFNKKQNTLCDSKNIVEHLDQKDELQRSNDKGIENKYPSNAQHENSHILLNENVNFKREISKVACKTETNYTTEHVEGIKQSTDNTSISEMTSTYQRPERIIASNQEDVYICNYELVVAASSRRLTFERDVVCTKGDQNNANSVHNLTQNILKSLPEVDFGERRKDLRRDSNCESRTTNCPTQTYSDQFVRLKNNEICGNNSNETYYIEKTNTPPHFEDEGVLETLKSGFKFVKKEIKYSYSSRTVIIWSLWWIFASYGNFQTGSYIQDLWKVVRDANGYKHSYNGAVEAGGMLLGSISVGLVAFVPIKWSSPGRCEILMTTVCALKATIYVVMSRTNLIWVAYVLYDFLRVINQVSITVESAEIAKALPGPRYGFVFGCNMFLALVIESVLTAVVVDNAGFGVHVRTQFLVYGIYSFAMALVFGVVALVTICRHTCIQKIPHEKGYNDSLKGIVKSDAKNIEFITHL